LTGRCVGQLRYGGYTELTDAERHMVLLEAIVNDSGLDLRIQAVDPDLLQMTALETDHSCCVQPAGTLLMPPERMIGNTADMRATLERSFDSQ